MVVVLLVMEVVGGMVEVVVLVVVVGVMGVVMVVEMAVEMVARGLTSRFQTRHLPTSSSHIWLLSFFFPPSFTNQ